MSLLWWLLGFADRARSTIREAISSSGSKSAALADALGCASHLYIDLREPKKVQEFAERQLALAREVGLPAQVELSSAFRGWALAQQGRTEEGRALIRSGLDSLLARGDKLNLEQFLGLLSSAQERGGYLKEALATIEKALSSIGEEETGATGALQRRGEIHLQLGEEAAAEQDFRATIAGAVRMGSKALELRATTSLVRLLAKQGRRDEGRTMLANIYNWFTEGFDTADLRDAKALLDELSEREA
jgi:predicted ATPase